MKERENKNSKRVEGGGLNAGERSEEGLEGNWERAKEKVIFRTMGIHFILNRF